MDPADVSRAIAEVDVAGTLAQDIAAQVGREVVGYRGTQREFADEISSAHVRRVH